MSFGEYLGALLVGPIAGPWGRRWAAAFAGALDPAGDAAQDAGLLRGPADAQDDVLPAIGASRVITRVPGEAIDGYRARLSAAWETWSWACTNRGVRGAIGLAALGAATLYTQRELPRGPRPEWWSRFTVVFSGLATWDAGLPWDGGFVWEGRVVAPIEAMTADDARRALRAAIAPWKSARDRVTSAIIARGAWLWDDGHAWDAPTTTWDGGPVTEIAAPTWDSDAMRWDSGDWCWDYLL